MLKFNKLVPAVMLICGFCNAQTPGLSVEAGAGRSPYLKDLSRNHASDYFFKIEYSGKTAGKRSWQLFMPFGLSYQNCSMMMPADRMKSASELILHNLVISFGPELRYIKKRFFISGAFLINTSVTLQAVEKRTDPVTSEIRQQRLGYGGTSLYMGPRLGASYKVNSRLFVGATLEVPFLDIGYLISTSKQRNDPFFGIEGSYLWINPGFRLGFIL